MRTKYKNSDEYYRTKYPELYFNSNYTTNLLNNNNFLNNQNYIIWKYDKLRFQKASNIDFLFFIWYIFIFSVLIFFFSLIINSSFLSYFLWIVMIWSMILYVLYPLLNIIWKHLPRSIKIWYLWIINKISFLEQRHVFVLKIIDKHWKIITDSRKYIIFKK